MDIPTHQSRVSIQPMRGPRMDVGAAGEAGRALEESGNVISLFAKKLEERQGINDINTFEIGMLDDVAKFEMAAEEDPDHRTIKERYMGEIDKSIAQRMSGVANKIARQKIDAIWAKKRTELELKLWDISRKKEKQIGAAAVYSLVPKKVDEYIRATPNEKENIRQEIIGIIDSSVATNTLDPVTATKFKNNTLSNLAVDQVNRDMLIDPNATKEKLVQGGYLGLEEGDRTAKLEQVQREIDTIDRRLVQQQEKAEKEAEKRIRKNQGIMESDLKARILNGERFQPQYFVDLERLGKLGDSGPDELMRWQEQADKETGGEAKENKIVRSNYSNEIEDLRTKDNPSIDEIRSIRRRIHKDVLNGDLNPSTEDHFINELNSLDNQVFKSDDWKDSIRMLEAMSLSFKYDNPNYKQEQGIKLEQYRMKMRDMVEGGMNPKEALAQIGETASKDALMIALRDDYLKINRDDFLVPQFLPSVSYESYTKEMIEKAIKDTIEANDNGQLKDYLGQMSSLQTYLSRFNQYETSLQTLQGIIGGGQNAGTAKK